MTAIAILHPQNLLGKELRETLGRREGGLQWTEVRLLSTRDDEVGALTEVAGAAAVVQRYEPDSLEGVSAAFFCGPVAANRAPLAALPPGVTAVVLSPDAGPQDGLPVVAGVNDGAARRGTVLRSPHPASVLLAHLLQPLFAPGARLEPSHAVATLIVPVSMHGDAGLEDLFEQTRQIVAMTPRRRSRVFGGQIAFNLLPDPNAATAAAVEEELAAVLATGLPVNIQTLQGGIFHCISASLCIHCAGEPGLPAMRRALAASPYLETAADPRHLGPVDAAASSKVLVGSPRREGDSFWLWAVMDNLTRGGALNAVEIAAAAA